MKHLAMADFDYNDDMGGAEMGPPALDNLSRDMAAAAAKLPDQRLRLLAAMQMLGNLRDFLIADISESAERAVDDAIQALMRSDRELPTDWAA